MAQVVRSLLWEWPRWHRRCCSGATFHHLLYSPFLLAIKITSQRHRNVHFRSRGLKLPDAPVPSDLREIPSDSDPDEKRSRNEKKREARRAVRWGMELATFSTPQIKRILRVASLEREVFDALMLVKRFGSDVKEGKRRQFNYIGKLLRKAQPELMDALIQASKDGDQSKLQALSGLDRWITGDDDEEAEDTELEEEEGSPNSIDIASRWVDGLINKDNDITNEVYSVQSVEFDRQELRKLVRKVHSMQERLVVIEENEGEEDAELMGAKKSLTRFLRDLTKRMPTE